VKVVYFFVSFSYLLFRTVAVALCAASIHDESRATKNILYAVPTQSYKIEVLSDETAAERFSDIIKQGCTNPRVTVVEATDVLYGSA
jgi:hypothetical protein